MLAQHAGHSGSRSMNEEHGHRTRNGFDSNIMTSIVVVFCIYWVLMWCLKVYVFDNNDKMFYTTALIMACMFFLGIWNFIKSKGIHGVSAYVGYGHKHHHHE